MKLALLAVLVIIATACSQEPTESIKVGGAFALTGDGASWGQDEFNAATLAIEQANAQGGIAGNKIEMITEDTRTDAKATLSAVQKLITIDDVQVIIGPTWGDSFGAIVGPIGEEEQVVQITPSGALEVAEDTQNFPSFFSTWYPQQAEVEQHIIYLKKHNISTVAIIHDNDAFNTKFSQLYADHASRNGITTKEFIVQTGSKDYKTILLKAKEEKVQVILIEIFDVADIGLIMKQMQELGMQQLVMGTASVQTPQLIESYGQYATDKIVYSFPDTQNDQYKKFLNDFKERFGHEPTGPSAGCAYDATNAAIAALKQGARSGEEIRQALYELKTAGTIVKKISFNDKGQIDSAPFIMKTIHNGEFVELNS